MSAFELFMGFSRYYNSLEVKFEESLNTHTSRIISYLDNLGRMLGYRILSELSFSKLYDLANKKCPPELKLKRPDMCWAIHTKKGFKYELVFESEQEMDEKKIKEDIEKLLFFPSKLKMLYCAHNNPNRVFDLVKNVAQKSSHKFKGKILLIVDPWVNRRTFSTGKLNGLLINSSLEITHVGIADVSEHHDGLFRIRSFKKVRWGPYE